MKPPIGFKHWRDVPYVLSGLPAKQFSLLANFAGQSYKQAGASATFEDVTNFTRSTSRYVWDANGQLVAIAANQPCYEYDPATGEAKGLFLNPESVTNYATYSASPNRTNNEYYTFSAAPSVFIGQQAQKATAVGSSAPDIFHTQVIAVTAGQVLSADAIIEDSGAPHAAVLLMYSGGIKASVSIGTDTGEILGGTGSVEFLHDVGPSGGKLWKVSIKYTAAADMNIYAALYIKTTAVSSGDSLIAHYLGLYLQSSAPSHPVVTDASAGTVAADVCDLTALPSDYGAIGCFIINYSDPKIGSAIREMLGDGTNAFFQLSADNLTVSATDGTNTASTSVTATGKNKVAVAWDATTLKICANGATPVTATHNGNLGTFASPPRLARGVAAWYSLLQYLPSTNTGGEIATDAKMQELTA